MPRRSLAHLYRDEFTNYSLAKFQQDLLAGLTVAAVALPFDAILERIIRIFGGTQCPSTKPPTSSFAMTRLQYVKRRFANLLIMCRRTSLIPCSTHPCREK